MKKNYEPVRKLCPGDNVDEFDCGQTELNEFLQRHALINQKANSSQTYVCCTDAVVGYYSLVVGSVVHEVVPHRVQVAGRVRPY